MTTSSPAISRRFILGEHTLTLTMRRGATAEMVQDTLWHLHTAIAFAVNGVFLTPHESENGDFHNRTDYGESPHEQSRVNVWGELMVDIGSTHVLMSINQCDEYTSAQDILDLIGEFAAAANENAALIEKTPPTAQRRISTVENTQTPPKTQEAPNLRVSVASQQTNGHEIVTIGDKSFILAPKIAKWDEIPEYPDDSRLAFRVIRIERTIAKLKDGTRPEVFEFSMPLPRENLKFEQRITIYADSKALTDNTDLKTKIEGMALQFGAPIEGRWILLGRSYHDKSGKQKFSYFGLETV